MSKKTLLQKAKSIETRKRVLNVTDEEIELCLAWVKGEVSLMQLNKAIGCKSISSSYAKIVMVLRAYILSKKL